MLGLRDVLFIAPTPSSLHQHTQIISSDHHPSLPLPSSTALGVSVGIFPLLAATPCLQPPPNQMPDEVSDRSRSLENLKRTQDFGFGKGDSLIGGGGNHGYDDQVKGDGGDGSLGVCRDCGNRAKKECEYRRCRTCCKGRGNHCSTHVKSTWVPASRRRERQMLVVMDGVATSGSSGSSSAGAKRPKVLIPSQTTAAASTSNATTPRSFETTSSHQDASFKKSLPGQVRAPAVFKCHRVTAISSGEGELTYQATVNIGGHVFKGFLYDQGADVKNALPSISQLHLESGNHLRD
ncbi:protein LATERAL ROOT PRIMORDIUM 1-like [Cucurbita pepo subsp. pepo]|uniref:protein LATERAL ROOT PRIMORDIUM 1-like n=1 Tax=Cucurbita pepo subsp. pepo TaxID=3664 RepID=UPI000C9D5975|nr:protein LATERAL ROOT PRIMORDIUM 1-like [Cucurbita pepo subsp. pepo]